jgi:hypothetical protein
MDILRRRILLGCLLAMYRRAFARKPSLGHNWRDWWLLSVLLALGLTGFVVEALPDALHTGATLACALVHRRMADRHHALARR